MIDSDFSNEKLAKWLLVMGRQEMSGFLDWGSFPLLPDVSIWDNSFPPLLGNLA